MNPVIRISVDTFTVTIASPAVFSLTGHGLAVDDIVYLKTTGALPTGLAVETAYYVISSGLTSDAFQLSATKGGSAINTSGSQSGTHTLYKDQTENIMPQSFNLERALTSQVDTCSFQMTRVNSVGSKPSVLKIVDVLENGTVIFGGQIVEMDESIQSNNLEVFSITAKDYTFDMDRYLVTQTYEDMTINQIITDFKNNWLPSGYTVTNVDADVNISYISFNYEYPSKCLQQLAELVNYDWYVDGEKNIYFKSKLATDAPFGLTDTNEKYHFNSLRIRTDVKNLRNTIYVRGGSYQSSQITEETIADGQAEIYTQGFRYSNVSVTVDSVAQTVGTDNLHDPADYDVLYNFQEKALKWRSDNKPANGDVIALTGKPHIPILIKKGDNPSQNTYGVFEFKIIDKTINSRQGARDRANAELNQWKDSINEGSFSTNEVGLDVGQRINVQSDIRELNTDFVITRISTRFDHDPTTFIHTCTLATTKTYGMIEFLQGLLVQRDKEIKIDENETIEIITSLMDSMTVTDTLGAVSTTSAPYVYDTAVWGFSTYA